MDKNFLAFWGEIFSSYIRGHNQMEEVVSWIHQGFKGFDEITELFQKAYGLDRLSESTSSYLKMWDQSIEDFQKSFSDYLSMLGVVPKQEYLRLVAKYEDLKATIAARDETIAHMKLLLDKKHLDQEEIQLGYQELIKKQTDEFQELLKNVVTFFPPGQPEKPGKTESKRATGTKKRKGTPPKSGT